MIKDTWLIAAKDLKIEWASKVVFSQIIPFGFLILLLFGIAISPELVISGDSGRKVLSQTAPGLFWLGVVFSTILAVGRSMSLESADSCLEALRMTGVDPASVFLGKVSAILLQLFTLELVTGVVAYLIYDVSIVRPLILLSTILLGTIAIANAGVLYAGISSGVKNKDTLLPLLLLPILTPILLVASRSTEAAIFSENSDGWIWVLLLGAFDLFYIGIGMLLFGSLMEES